MINWRTLLFGLGFGLIDSIALPITKAVSNGLNKWFMVIPMVFYAFSPLVFLKALSSESLTIMNLVWDLSSDIIVTLIGLFVFSEKISPVKLMGVLIGMCSLVLLTYDSPAWNGFLAENFHMSGGIFE
jgi:multidrug transporter EmrE-like cation transporter